MKRHWYVLYGAMIVFFIACAIVIPNQAIPWVLTAVMTALAAGWHREQAFAQRTLKTARQFLVDANKNAEYWRKAAYKAEYERDVLEERTRDEETNCDMHAVKLHVRKPADFPKGSTPTPSPIDKALAEMYRHARPYTRPLIQTDHHGERTET